MKLLIASDIHGDLDSARRMIAALEGEGCDKLMILGDVLYHGPRNDLPPTYAPKEVISLLNAYKDRIIAVRGNCDAEVDQMVLEFPILADYCQLSLDGLTVFATHGHKYNLDSLPPLGEEDIILHGHTHLYAIQKVDGSPLYLNPGSVSIPKNNNPRTYMIYENRSFTLKDIDGRVISEKKL